MSSSLRMVAAISVMLRRLVLLRITGMLRTHTPQHGRQTRYVTCLPYLLERKARAASPVRVGLGQRAGHILGVGFLPGVLQVDHQPVRVAFASQLGRGLE